MKKIIFSLFLISLVSSRVSAQSDVEDLSGLLKLIQKDVCTDSTNIICKHLKNFQKGSIPNFPAGDYFTVGNMVFNSDSVEKNYFITVMTRREGDKISITNLPIKPSNEEELADINEYIKNLESGIKQESNSVHGFVKGIFHKQEFYTAETKGSTLVYKDPSGFANGIVYLREKDGFLYLFALKNKPKAYGSFDRVPAFLFAFFPLTR